MTLIVPKGGLKEAFP